MSIKPRHALKVAAWDNQWASQSDFIDWLESVIIEYVRVLKPAGSLYLFMGPKMAATVERMVARHMVVENHIVWIKPTCMHKRQCRANLRRYFPATERIIFATQREHSESKAQYAAIAEACEPVISYLRDVLAWCGFSQSDVARAIGVQMAGHWFGRSQWRLPTEAQYEQLQPLFNGRLTRQYSDVKAQCDALISDAAKPARRHFDVDGRDWFTDAWACQPVQYYPGKHPCEKPLSMMMHIVTASTVPGSVVLDPFMGGGTTGVASIRTGRSFIGCEMEKANFDAAKARMEAV